MKLILFGAGHYGRDAISYFGEENVFCFCDNSVKIGEERKACGKRVISFEEFCGICHNYIVVVCIKLEFCLEVCKQLEEAGVKQYVVFEALRNGGKTAEDWMACLQNEEERGDIQRKSYLFLLNKAMTQVNYLKQHAEITTLKPATGKLREYQFLLLDRAKEFFKFVEEVNIKPFLISGNLIGAVRHQGFIPWDDDLDFGLMRDDYERLLEFAYENCVVMTYEPGENVWADRDGNTIEEDELCKRYPGKYVFNLRPEFIQISKCMETVNVFYMDLWAFDFYKEEYDIREHKKWVDKINEEAAKKKTRREQMLFIREAQQNNPMVSREMTAYFYPGIDNFCGVNGGPDIDSWIMSKDIFPLQEVKYENTTFLAPRNMEELLRHEFTDFMQFPDDVGLLAHGEGGAE